MAEENNEPILGERQLVNLRMMIDTAIAQYEKFSGLEVRQMASQAKLPRVDVTVGLPRSES